MNAITTTQTHELITTSGTPLDQHPAAVYLGSLSPNSRRTMQASLAAVALLLTGGQVADPLAINWAAVRYQHVAAIRGVLAERYKPASANRMLSAIRGVLRAAWLLGQLSAEDYQRAAAVPPVSGQTLPAGRELSAGEITALMHTCNQDNDPAGVRDAAVIALLYAAGLRRAELVALDMGDYEPGTGRLVVHGKRNKERNAWLVNGAKYALDDWLELRGTEPGALFVPVNKGGKLGQRRMTTQAIYNMLRRRAAEAGISTPFSPHDLRRTFVSDLLAAGADIAVVARMAGHSNVGTTARYDRRPESAKQQAAGLLHVPYIKRKRL